jgi:hypothetical protein
MIRDDKAHKNPGSLLTVGVSCAPGMSAEPEG